MLNIKYYYFASGFAMPSIVYFLMLNVIALRPTGYVFLLFIGVPLLFAVFFNFLTD